VDKPYENLAVQPDYISEEDQARNNEWVRALMTFERNVIGNHALFNERGAWVNPLAYSGNGFSHVFHDPQLQAGFSSRVEALIEDIPKLQEYEILYSISEILALLGDSHTQVTIPAGATFPLHVVYIENAYHVWRVPSGYEHLLFSELVSINGVSIDYIFEQLKRIDPHENEYFLRIRLGIMFREEFLSYIGVIDRAVYEESMGIPFGFDIDGDIVYINFTAAAEHTNLIEHSGTEGFFRDSRAGYNYWYEFLIEYNMLYIRYAAMHQMADLSFDEFHEDIMNAIQEIVSARGSLYKVVFDLRNNFGGGAPPLLEFATFLNKVRINDIYILIDNRTYSAAVTTAVILDELLENVTIIGEPAAQPPNFFSGGGQRFNEILPGQGAIYRVTREAIALRPDYEGDALRPDVYIPQTLEAFINNRDLILDAVKAGGYQG